MSSQSHSRISSLCVCARVSFIYELSVHLQDPSFPHYTILYCIVPRFSVVFRSRWIRRARPASLWPTSASSWTRSRCTPSSTRSHATRPRHIDTSYYIVLYVVWVGAFTHILNQPNLVSLGGPNVLQVLQDYMHLDLDISIYIYMNVSIILYSGCVNSQIF